MRVSETSETIGVESFGVKALQEENECLNKWHSIAHVVGNVNEVPALMKTKEQRQAELQEALATLK